MKESAIFDVDGTMVMGQSQALFLKYLLSKKAIGIGFYIKLMIWFALYKLGMISDPKKPMEYAFSFLKGMPVGDVAATVQDFFSTVLEGYIYKDALEVIDEHRAAGRQIILVSNAMEPIVKAMASFVKADAYISTVLEVHDGAYTGRIVSMMYGEQKVEAIKRFAFEHSVDLRNSWAYGDHPSDEAFLFTVEHPCAVNAKGSLPSIARRNGWQTLTFKGTAR